MNAIVSSLLDAFLQVGDDRIIIIRTIYQAVHSMISGGTFFARQVIGKTRTPMVRYYFTDAKYVIAFISVRRDNSF